MKYKSILDDLENDKSDKKLDTIKKEEYKLIQIIDNEGKLKTIWIKQND